MQLIWASSDQEDLPNEDSVLVEFDERFTVRADDAIFVCGSTNSLDRYQRQFETTPAARA